MLDEHRDEHGERSARARDIARMVITAAAILYVVVFIASNTQEIRIDFVFVSARVSLVVALALVAVLAFLAGAVAAGILRRRNH